MSKLRSTLEGIADDALLSPDELRDVLKMVDEIAKENSNQFRRKLTLDQAQEVLNYIKTCELFGLYKKKYYKIIQDHYGISSATFNRIRRRLGRFSQLQENTPDYLATWYAVRPQEKKFLKQPEENLDTSMQSETTSATSTQTSSILKINWADFYSDVKVVVENIKNRYAVQNKEISLMIGISRGGIIPQGIIANQLNVKNNATINISTYTEDNVQDFDASEVKTIIASQIENILTQKIDGISLLDIAKQKQVEILVVDDLIDSGTTMSLISEVFSGILYYQNVLNKATINVKYAAIYNKGVSDTDFLNIELPSPSWIEFPWDR